MGEKYRLCAPDRFFNDPSRVCVVDDTYRLIVHYHRETQLSTAEWLVRELNSAYAAGREEERKACTDERRAAEEMVKWIENELNEDARHETGENVIANYRRTRGGE